MKTAAIPRYRTDPSFMQSVWIEISVGSTFKEARHYGSGMSDTATLTRETFSARVGEIVQSLCYNTF